ncbi:hypothetical protein HDU98_005199, partial [Podochytrium sp. JEL0797]
LTLVQHAAKYAEHGKEKLTQKESLKLVSRVCLDRAVHHNTRYVRGFYRYVLYEFPKNEVLMLRDFVQPVSKGSVCAEQVQQ